MPAPVFCPGCGANMNLVDRMHRCVPRRRPESEVVPADANDRRPITNPETRPLPQTDPAGAAPLIELKSNVPITKIKRKRAPNGTFDRRKYQRELMRKRRKEGKA